MYKQSNTINRMTSFSDVPITINISGNEMEQIKTYLKIFLASRKLADAELNVTAVLVKKYATYIKDGLKEPYASHYLFSAEIRKEITEELNMTAQHLSNKLIILCKKDIVAVRDKSYVLNPLILPTKTLTFVFG